MKLAIMQPYFLPYLGYFQLMAAVDKFVVYDDVHFIKRGWINRNRILLNGKAHLFTVPLLGASQNRLINELQVFTSETCKSKLIATLEQAYRRAPQFSEVMPVLKNLIACHDKMLGDYLWNSLTKLKSWLEIPAELVRTSSIYHNTELKGQDRIIDICRQERCKTYVNGRGGRALYDAAFFRSHGLELRFLESNLLTYSQFDEVFHPDLSIVDVMMFNPREKVKRFLREAELQS